MPSDRKKKQAAAKASKKAAAAGGEDGGSGDEGGHHTPVMSANQSLADLTKALESAAIVDSGRTCAGVLSSHPQSRDVHVSSLTLLYHGHMLLEDADLELNFGRCAPGLHGVHGRQPA